MEPFQGDEDGDTSIRAFLLTMFPEGVHLKYMGKELSEATPESFDDAIDIVMSEKRDSLTGGALMEPMKIVQDGFNDFKNSEREYYEKGWPMTHFKGIRKTTTPSLTSNPACPVQPHQERRGWSGCSARQCILF